MKLGIFISLAVVLVVVNTAYVRPIFKLQPLDWSAPTLVTDIITTCATSKDLLVFVNADDNNPGAEIRRRNNAGDYVRVAYINGTDAISLYPSTNGKWIAFGDSFTNVYLYSIDDNNVVSPAHYLLSSGGFLLSDDTFVGLVPSPDFMESATVTTWEYDSAIKNWTEVPNTELVVPFPGFYTGDVSSYRATDTHLVLNDFSNSPFNCSVYLYERNADKSWDLLDNVPFNCSGTAMFPASPTYNGVDTLVVANGYDSFDGYYYGIVRVFTKKSGVWNERIFDSKSLGYRLPGYMGFAVLFLDPDTLLVSVGGDALQDVNGVLAGKVLMLTRDANGLWQDSLDLASDGAPGAFGLTMGVNDHDLLVPNFNPGPSLTLTYYTAPLCFYKPVNATCMDVQLNDCSDIEPSTLYTINNPECGDVSVDVSELSVTSANKIEATVVFTKGFGVSVTCTASITCPAPPVTIVPVGASKSSAYATRINLATELMATVALLMLY